MFSISATRTSVHQTFFFLKQTDAHLTCFLWFHLLNSLHVSLMHRELMYANCNMKPSFSGLRVVVLAFLVSDYIQPLVSLEFELAILALTSATLIFTVFALWLKLSLLKSPKHLFNLVIVLKAYKRPYKKVCHIHTHTESLLYWLRQLNLSH